MTPQQFCYWLQGFVELHEADRPSLEQWESIKQHLSTVFKKETPAFRGSQVIVDNDTFQQTDPIKYNPTYSKPLIVC